MVQRFTRILILSLMLLITVPLMAQDETDLDQTYTFTDGTEISYPEDWQLEIDENDGSIFIFYETDEDYIDVNFLPPEVLTDIYAIDSSMDWQVIIEDLFFYVYGIDETEVDDEAFTLEEGIIFYDVDQYSYFMIYPLEEDQYVMMFVIVDTQDEDLLETLGRVLVSPLGEDAEIPPSRLCQLTVETVDTTQIYVGPGENRPVVSYLPAELEISPTGRYITEDGSVWFKLNEELLELEGVVDDVWVPANSIGASGNCIDIPYVVPFPIIPQADEETIAAIEEGEISTELETVVDEIITFAEMVGPEIYCETLQTLSTDKLALITPLLNNMNAEQVERLSAAIPDPC